jgi:O-antigen biosynthesis protein WbqP
MKRIFDTFDDAKPRFLNRGKKCRSVSTLSIPRASDRGVEWVDLLLSICLVPVLLSPILVIAVMVRLTSKGPAWYWSDRVGVGNRIFKMPKFRTMRVDTPAVATHLLENPDEFLTPIGPFLRKSSLDELPQLWSVLKGDMIFLGSRPALFNQHDLIALGGEKGVPKLIPGITGCTQINDRDDIPIPLKVERVPRRWFCF